MASAGGQLRALNRCARKPSQRRKPRGERVSCNHAYADNYLVDVKFGVIVDVEATRTNLLDQSRRPSCSRLGSHWDRCGVHYVEPIEGKTK